MPHGSRVADVGADHGLLSRLLLRSGRARFCVATERDRRGAERLRRAARERGMPAGLEIREGDGLQALRPADRLGVVVAAGMGARSMLRLLEQDPGGDLGITRFVLQPLSEPARLRRGLAERGFGIAEERLVLERRRFYTVIAADRGEHDPYEGHPLLDREDLYEAGPCLVRDAGELVKRLWERERRLQAKLLERAALGPGRKAARERLAQAERILAALESGRV